MSNEKQRDKKDGGSIKSFIVLAVIILLCYLFYDNVIASHWVIVFHIDGDISHFNIDQNGQKFKDAASCLSYAVDLNSQSNLFKYECGYRCKQSDYEPYVYCEKWS